MRIATGAEPADTTPLSDIVPITVRPTRADVMIANAIARNTGPVPEAIARALTWGADEKVLLAFGRGGLAGFSRARRAAATGGQSRSACHRDGVAAAARLKDRVRSDPARSYDHPRACPRRTVFRQAQGRLSLRPRAAHGRARLGRRPIACRVLAWRSGRLRSASR